MKRRIAIGLALIGVLVGAWWLFLRPAKKDTAQDIVVAAVKRKDFVKTVESSGKTKASAFAQLSFQTSGRLAWVGVKEGDTVSKYQAIASLDRREVEKNLQKTLTDYSKQRNDFEETWRVTYRGVSNPNEALTDTVKRILEKNQWDLNKAVYDVELKHLAWEYSTLTSPLAGKVTHIDTPVAGVNITPATSTFEIVDPGSLLFDANVDEIDVGTLKEGQKATVRLDAFPDQTFTGTITTIAFAAETSAGGATVFPVEIRFDTPQQLRIGLNGDVSIVSASVSGALVVPISALREEQGQKYVYVKSQQTYKKTPVVTGLVGRDEAVLTGGLSEGEEVVTKGFNKLPK